MADDAAKVAPHVYKVVFENERARVLEVTMEAGARSELHAHPDYFVYFLAAGKVRFTRLKYRRTRGCGGKLRSTQPRTSAVLLSVRFSSSQSRARLPRSGVG